MGVSIRLVYFILTQELLSNIRIKATNDGAEAIRPGNRTRYVELGPKYFDHYDKSWIYWHDPEVKAPVLTIETFYITEAK